MRSLGIPGCRWGIILKWMFEKWDGAIDWIDLAGTCECGNELLDSIKCGEFPD
jgi:hypothetical protein